MITCRGNCICWTEVETASATDLLVSGMGADCLINVYVAGFFELTNQVSDFKQRLLNVRWVARVRIKISIAFFWRIKQRLVTAKIKDDIATGCAGLCVFIEA